MAKISLEKATATSDTEIVLTLSLAVNKESGTNVDNYALTPDVTVTSATLDEATDFIVHLKANMKPGKKYEVAVKNLVSILGTGLDPDHMTADFTTPKS